MPVPKRRRSSSRRDRGRANKNLAEKNVSTCPNCHAAKLPHRVCPSCGYYKDRPYTVNVSS